MSKFHVESVPSDTLEGHYINRVKIKGEYVTACFPNTNNICYHRSLIDAQNEARYITRICLGA